MDALDAFRKLSRGAKFSKKAFNNKPNESLVTKTPQVKCEIVPKTEPLTSEDEEFVELSLLKKSIKKEVKNESENENNEEELQQEKIYHIRKLNRISVIGANIPNPVESFEQLITDYNVLPVIVKNLKSCGFTAPTPIQMQAIPVMLSGRQILACAPTGSGKTAAFLVPVINSLKKPSKEGFRALIVCPTRELARQIFRECNLLTEGTGLCTYLISKVSQKYIENGVNFTRKIDILITTPNRLIYMLKQENTIDLKAVEWLIVDESDKLFEVGVRGFREQLAEIYKACSSDNLKRAMFSATHAHHVAHWCKKNLEGLISVTIGYRNTTTDLVEQKLLYVGSEEGKLVEIRNIIHEGLHPPVLIFLQSKERAKSLFNELIYDGINVDIIHAGRTQLQRDNVIKAFREGKIWVLICTELMGRGIDFKGINLVINYDFPQSAISYIHRVGRTGRAGRPGKAITFFTEIDKPMLRNIAKVMKDSGCDVPDYMLGLRRPNKKLKSKLENKAPKREAISIEPARFKRKESLKNSKLKNKKRKVDVTK